MAFATEVAATAASTASAPSPTTKVAAGRALFARTGFIDGQCTALEILAVELFDSTVGLFLAAHLDEGKPARTVGKLVHNQFALHDMTDLFEQIKNIPFGGVEGQVADEKSGSHTDTFLLRRERSQ